MVGSNRNQKQMAEFIEITKAWFLSLGQQYGVNPLIFGTIYVGAIPFFAGSLAWLYKNYKRGRSIILPALSALFFFISAYLYLIIVGNNVPWWVYVIVVVMVSYGAYSTYLKVRRKIDKIDERLPNDEQL